MEIAIEQTYLNNLGHGAVALRRMENGKVSELAVSVKKQVRSSLYQRRFSRTGSSPTSLPRRTSYMCIGGRNYANPEIILAFGGDCGMFAARNFNGSEYASV
ncbi:MAG: hypothetical protein WA477_02695 [Candidatus Sulfotelmatobacter sp.]